MERNMMNGGYNRNENGNVNAQAQKPEQTCYKEEKTNFFGKVEKFATEHKTGIIIGAALALTTGAAYLLEKKYGLLKKVFKKKAKEVQPEAPKEEN